jgi:hypothetical protein
MTMPFVLPDWVPWWVPLVLIVPALLYALAFVFMPFSVLGVKPRLEAIERPPIPPSLDDLDDDSPVERPAPSPTMRPYRRAEPPVVRPQRAEPRLGPRR